MRCKEIQKLIYLMENELSKAEIQKLEHHLKKCARCRAVRDALGASPEIIEEIKKSPKLENAAMLTNDIMRSIRHMTKFAKRRENPFDNLLDALAFKAVRIALASSIVFVFGFFFVQEVAVIKRLNHLERRLAQHASSAMFTPITGTSKNILNQLGKNEKVMIDKELLEDFMQSYGELQMKNRFLLRTLEKQAKKSNITWQDGLTDDEIKSLLESESIRQKLKNL